MISREEFEQAGRRGGAGPDVHGLDALHAHEPGLDLLHQAVLRVGRQKALFEDGPELVPELVTAPPLYIPIL